MRVRDTRGAPVGRVLVRLLSQVGTNSFSAYTQEDGNLEFRGLPLDEYTIEVEAAGYLTAREAVRRGEILNSARIVPQVFIYLRKESDVDSSAAPSKPLVSNSKVQKEIKKTREKLAKGDLKGAQKQLERAQRASPDHPEVHYLLGMLHLRRQATQAAQQHLEKAIDLYPQHVPALRALGRLRYQQGDLPGAVKRLEQALAVIGRSADDHILLAQALLQQNELEKAAFHARQAVEQTEGKQPQMRLVLCQVLLAQHKYSEAEVALEAYLREFPNHEDASTAREVLQSIPRVQAGGAGNEAGLGGTLRIAKPADSTTPAALVPTEAESEVSWAPLDMDANPPAVFHDVPCQADEVLSRVRERVQDMASNLGDVNAEETISHVDINRHGQPAGSETRRFDYAVSIQTARDGTLTFKEMRDGVFGMEALGGFATNAIAVMALVFHPYYAEDFAMRCEGQGMWQGQPVWFVHFRQREDRPARIHGFRSRLGSFHIPLKGRAWIAANSYEIVRLETAMVEPLPAARLEQEQMVIEYGPVRFAERQRTFWLPASADIYLQYHGRRWHRRHVLQKYVHFAVDTKQKIVSPEPPREPPAPP